MCFIVLQNGSESRGIVSIPIAAVNILDLGERRKPNRCGMGLMDVEPLDLRLCLPQDEDYVFDRPRIVPVAQPAREEVST